MKKYLIFGAVAAAVGACDEIPKSAVDLTCGAYKISASIYANRIEAAINNQEVVLTKIDFHSGIRYRSTGKPLAGAVLWDKGEDWSLLLKNGGLEIDCAVLTHDVGTQVADQLTTPPQ
jgi:hypothetical protein